MAQITPENQLTSYCKLIYLYSTLTVMKLFVFFKIETKNVASSKLYNIQAIEY